MFFPIVFEQIRYNPRGIFSKLDAASAVGQVFEGFRVQKKKKKHRSPRPSILKTIPHVDQFL